MARFNYHKPIFVMILNLVSVICLLMVALYLSSTLSGGISVTFGIIYFAISLLVLSEANGRKVVISDEGVSYSFFSTRYSIKWENIKHVDIRMTIGGRARVEALCFSTKWIGNNIYKENMSDEFIMMLNTSKGVIREVRKYWKSRIGGVEHIEDYD